MSIKDKKPQNCDRITPNSRSHTATKNNLVSQYHDWLTASNTGTHQNLLASNNTSNINSTQIWVNKGIGNFHQRAILQGSDGCSSYQWRVRSLLHQKTQGFFLFKYSRTPMLIDCTCWIKKFYLPILPYNINLQSLYSWLSGNPLNAIFIKQVLDHKGNRKVKHCIICFCMTDTLLSCPESCTEQFPPKNFPRVLITVCTAGTPSQEL